MFRVRRAAWRAVFALLLLTSSACRRGENATPGGKPPEFPNAPVILISIDTLRSDHLPAYGYPAVKTPNLDRFRGESVLFQRAYSQSPMTLPSHTTMLTGQLPGTHGVRNNVGYSLDTKKTPYLPCIAKQHGFATGAAVSTYVLRAESGLSSCFDLYDDTITSGPGTEFVEQQRPGRVTEKIAQQWVTAHSTSPFFFFFHIYEPHAPYDPPEPFKGAYANAYDGEIANADDIVGTFLDSLRASGVYDKAIIIITADHGEGLGDHGESQHSILLYREAIQVPLFVRLPGGARGGTTVADPVELADLTPTILGVLGLSSERKMDGRNIFAIPPDHSAFSETLYPRIHLAWSDLASLVQGRYHYIHGPKPELYDVVADPGEKKNLIADQRRETARMREAIKPLLVPMTPLSQIDPDTAAKLASLGYIGTARSDTAGSLPNPRDEIGSLEKLRDALLLADQGHVDEAIRAMDQMLAAHPSMFEGWNQFGAMLTRAGRNERAAEAYEKAIALAPFPPSDLMIEAGYAHLRAGQFQKAENLARLATKDLPEKGHVLVARVLLAKGNAQEAEREAQAAVQARATSPVAVVLLAETQEKQGRYAEALQNVEKAQQLATSRLTGPVYGLDFVRGDTLARMERPEEAAQAFEREVQSFPAHLEAWSSLCVLQFIGNGPGAVEQTLQRMVAANPNRGAYLFAAKTLDALEQPRAAAAWRERAKNVR